MFMARKGETQASKWAQEQGKGGIEFPALCQGHHPGVLPKILEE